MNVQNINNVIKITAGCWNVKVPIYIHTLTNTLFIVLLYVVLFGDSNQNPQDPRAIYRLSILM